MMPSYTLSTPAIFDITPITGNGSDYEALNLLINGMAPHVQSKQSQPTAS